MNELNLLNEWQERLGLQDWVIRLYPNCERKEVDEGNSIGETLWQTTNKTAIIKIMAEKEYDEEYMIPYDFEKTLVHELLHIKFSLIDKDLNTYEGIVAEQVRHQLIDDLARAFVMAKRGETKRKLDCEKLKNMNS